MHTRVHAHGIGKYMHAYRHTYVHACTYAWRAVGVTAPCLWAVGRYHRREAVGALLDFKAALKLLLLTIRINHSYTLLIII